MPFVLNGGIVRPGTDDSAEVTGLTPEVSATEQAWSGGRAGLDADGPEGRPRGFTERGPSGWWGRLRQPGEARDPVGRARMAGEVDGPARPPSPFLLGRLEEGDHPLRIEPGRDDELHAQGIGLLLGSASVAELAEHAPRQIDLAGESAGVNQVLSLLLELPDRREALHDVEVLLSPRVDIA